MQHLEVSGTVRPLKWSLGVKWLIYNHDVLSFIKVGEMIVRLLVWDNHTHKINNKCSVFMG